MLETFLNSHGSSPYAKYARARIAELKQQTAMMTPPAKPPVENSATPAAPPLAAPAPDAKEQRWKKTPVNAPAQHPVESLRDFFLGTWRVDQLGSGTLVTYYKDGAFQGTQYGGGPKRTSGKWRFEPLGADVFRLSLTYDNLPPWRGTFKIIDRDHIHNIDQNYMAIRER
jgi:hypothetical protein